MTGGAEGIGAALCDGLGAAGAAIAVCDVVDPTDTVDRLLAAG
ncbi:hypothetical protein GCM10010472_64560 [Pseudonocardia halophobica]|uniref:Uncharacterized protein n=1 Tax=Pseudonocardia halophobica TaxID=29401 RepID=A0A9W6P0H1_9PSEU|nr:hypothetical protein [Pseudonocardia halophobica]GLL15526.1 hypothetical protein GCM10017577_66770 [Pseudonocardia halophobica]